MFEVVDINGNKLAGPGPWQVIDANGNQINNYGTGTVTSVALSLPSIFTVSGSPVTTTGTLTGTLNTQVANVVFAGPSSGGAATPTFRALVAADIPSLPYGTGTVTTVSVVTANGVSGTVANPTTTPAITLTLGNIVPTSVSVTGTGGAGFVELLTQSSTPAAGVAKSVRLFSNNATGDFSWIQKSDGYVRTLTGTMTHDNSYTLPNVNGVTIGVFGGFASNSIPYCSSTTGLLSVSAKLQYDSSFRLQITDGVGTGTGDCNVSKALNGGTSSFVASNSGTGLAYESYLLVEAGNNLCNFTRRQSTYTGNYSNSNIPNANLFFIECRKTSTTADAPIIITGSVVALISGVTATNIGLSATSGGILFDQYQNLNNTANYAIDVKNGDIGLGTLGKKYRIKTGSNASAGTGTLAAGTATISTTAVTASSLIFLSDAGGGVLANIGSLSVGTITAATSFVVNSSNALDTSNFNWWIIEPY